MHEEIKLGAATRDPWLDNYYENIRVVGSAGISVVYYNFMPVFDWIRTDLAQQQPDGSTALACSHSNMQAMDLSIGTGQLPGWGAVYDDPNSITYLMLGRSSMRSAYGSIWLSSLRDSFR